MGNVSSRPDDGAPLYLRDPTRREYPDPVRTSFEGIEYANHYATAVTISSLSITNSRKKTVLNIVPNGFPATKVSALRDLGDSAVVEYVQVTTSRIHCIWWYQQC
jgi:Arf-GAP/SH3 domain/ANK repeat/PH domain-containing protein